MNEYKTSSILHFDFQSGVLFDWTNFRFPGKLHSWLGNSESMFGKPNSSNTFYGYVFSGTVEIKTNSVYYRLVEEQYFCLNGSFSIKGGSGIIIECMNYKGMNVVGGPIEEWGRLKYIDGCTDTLLISPPKYGDPCLNVLYFPENINQTAHTHPSLRAGIIAKGTGECITPDGVLPLSPGKIFIIPENKLHNFKTQDSEMVVIAFHPDSDFGPEDHNHPMINRTIIV